MKRFSGIFTFIGAICFGFTFFVSTFNYEQKRSTASLKNNYDLTCLSGDELKKAILDRVIMGFKSTRKDGYLGMNIGHYTYSDSEEEKKTICANKERSISSAFSLKSEKMACDLYPKIHIKFVADGESSSGEKRALEIETACTVSADMGRTEIFWIPWKQLALVTPFEGVSEYSKPSKVTVKTKHITDKWPTKWMLSQIEMVGVNGTITVNHPEIHTIAGRDFVFEFN